MRKLLLFKILFIVSFLFSLTAVNSSTDQKVLYEGSMKEEIYDAEYEIISDQLVPKFIATGKKIEIFGQKRLIKSLSLQNKLGYKVRVNISPDKKYFAISQAIASDEKTATLRQYEVYSHNGDLIWEKQSDRFLFFIERFSSYKEGTYYFFHPEISGLGILNKNIDKFIETKGIVNSITINDDKLLVVSKDKSDNQIRIILLDSVGNSIWEETYTIGNGYEPIIKMYDEKYLFAYEYNNSNIFVVKNYKKEPVFKYSTNSNDDKFDGEISENYCFLTSGNVISKNNMITNKIEQTLKLKGQIEYIKKINKDVFLWHTNSNKHYLSLLNEELNEIWDKEIKLPLYEVGPPKDIKVIGRHIILLFPTRILSISK